jgi:hypothetical protein
MHGLLCEKETGARAGHPTESARCGAGATPSGAGTWCARSRRIPRRRVERRRLDPTHHRNCLSYHTTYGCALRASAASARSRRRSACQRACAGAAPRPG